MAPYSITIDVGSTDSMTYADMADLQITQTASSVDTWSAVLPEVRPFDEYLLSDIQITYGTDVVFQGVLESYDVNYTDGTTEVRGRGPLASLEQEVIARQYSGQSAFQTLNQLWDETTFDALVSPPNSDVRDELYATEGQLRGLWSGSGENEDVTLHNADAHLESHKIVFESPNTTLDENIDYDGFNGANIFTDPIDRFFISVNTADAVEWIKGGMRRVDAQTEGVTDEIVYDTNSYTTGQREHLFEFQFSANGEYFEPILEIGDYTTDVLQCDLIIPDESGFITLDDVELDGTRLDVIEEVHDIAGYEFGIKDYETRDVRSFPKGTIATDQDWTVTSATKQKNIKDYANAVTVHGKRLSDGTLNTASRQNQAEIDRLNALGVGNNGKIESYEKNTKLETQAEVDGRADRLLKESIDEWDEGGSLEIAPQFVSPGYVYNPSPWGDAFPYGGRLGSNSLYFDGTANLDIATDFGGDSQPSWTFEAEVYPQELHTLGDDQYQTLLCVPDTDTNGNPIENFYVRLYGDGSIRCGFSDNDTAPYYVRSGPDVVDNQTSQRISIQNYRGRYRYFVDGVEVIDDGPADNYNPTIDPPDFLVGESTVTNTNFVGGINDIRIWLDTDDTLRSPAKIREFANKDLIASNANITTCEIYLRLNNHTNSTPINDGTDNFETIVNNGAVYQTNFGQLDEVSYSLGSGDTISLDFDISGRLDTELVDIKRRGATTRRSL